MATKASKTRSSSAQSTPQVPSSSTSSVQSPMTPTRLSRIQEKNALAGLNDRLAAYIERNQQLEQENATYKKQFNSIEENMNKSITRVKTDYDKEVLGLRKLVDETAKNNNKLENDTRALRGDVDDLKSKLDKKTKDYQVAQKAATQLEKTLADLQATATVATSERDKLLAEKKDHEAEINRLGREAADLRTRFEQESMARVEAENLLRNKSEELQFNSQLHEKEIVEMRTRRQVEIQEVDGRLQQEYETKLQQSLQELRAEYEAQLRANKEELDNLYDQKYSDLKNQLKRTQGTLTSKNDEITTLQHKLETSCTSSSKFEQQIGELTKKIKELEKKSDEDHIRFAKLLDVRDSEIEDLMKEKAGLMADYQDLMDTKVALDNEIATYRKLLEVEERRLSISPRGLKRGMTPIGERRGTPLRAVKKARFEQLYDESSANYETESIKHGDIAIEEDDVEGKFVKLRNTGDKDVSLSGWILIRRSGEIEISHKFHRQMKLEPNGVVTIWSADAPGAVHDLPSNLIMKGQKWFPSDNVVTILQNNEHQEVANRTTKRVQRGRQRKALIFPRQEDLFQQEGEVGAQGERCVIC